MLLATAALAASALTPRALLVARAQAAAAFEAPQRTAASTGTEGRQVADTVTVEARRKRELERQISRFVAGVDVTYLNDSLERWFAPICPLVAGLPTERGEFMLARLSQVARNARAPLAPEHCDPNLFIVVTADPHGLVDKWIRRDRDLFNRCNGFGYLREFLDSRRAIRVLYNAALRSSDGADRDPAQFYLAGMRLDVPLSSCLSAGISGTRLRYGAVQALSSVIIVVDSTRISHLNMGQLADYVSMEGLAQIRPDADPGAAPSILGLFRGSAAPPQGLSAWDRAFLASLYATDPASVLQVSAIKSRMFDQIRDDGASNSTPPGGAE